MIKMLIVLFIVAGMAACNEETVGPSTERKSLPVTFTVEAISSNCVSTYYMLAVIDNRDVEKQFTFDCKIATGTIDALPGDVVEIRIYSDDKFDRSIKYNVSVTQNVIDVFKGVDYTGIKFTAK